MASNIMDEYRAYGRPITTPAVEIATVMRIMPYGDFVDLMLEFSGGDEVLQQVLAKRIWAWATKPG